MHLLTRQMSWRSWCRRESGDTLDWRTESLLPCWYKLSLGYSCAVGLNIHPHLEAKTAKACKNEKQGEKLARPTPCFLVTTVWAGGALLLGFFVFLKFDYQKCPKYPFYWEGVRSFIPLESTVTFRGNNKTSNADKQFYRKTKISAAPYPSKSQVFLSELLIQWDLQPGPCE